MSYVTLEKRNIIFKQLIGKVVWTLKELDWLLSLHV